MNTLRNLDRINKQKSFLSYFSIGFAFIFAIYMYVSSEKKVEKSRKHAYILKEDGNIFVGELTSVRENRKVEVDHHLRMLHNALFFLNPDENSIQNNIQNTAFYLGDNSIVEFHNRRTNKDFYNDLIRTGSILEYKMDSIKINIQTYPYRAICWGRQRTIREREIIYHKIVTENYLINTIRKKKNPHGLSDTFKLIEYQEIYRKERKN